VGAAATVAVGAGVGLGTKATEKGESVEIAYGTGVTSCARARVRPEMRQRMSKTAKPAAMIRLQRNRTVEVVEEGCSGIIDTGIVGIDSDRATHLLRECVAQPRLR
jgi:hypothetical protein